MKIVVTADVHIHPYRICSRDNGADRLRDGLNVLRQSLELAMKRDALWIMAGDFKQPKTNWPQEALTGAHEILREYHLVAKYMIAGNHDAMGLGGSGLAPFKDCVTVIEGEAEDHRGILFVPFGADLTNVKTNKHLPIVAHAFLKGAFIGPEDMRLPDKGVDLADYGPFPVAFFGDIHKAQARWPVSVEAGRGASWGGISVAGLVRGKGMGGPGWRGEVFYPGSPYMQNWGERNDGVKGFLLADLKTGQVDMIESDAPRFLHVELVDCDMLPEILLQPRVAKDFVRIITDSAKWTQKALEAKGLTYRSLQVIERPRVEKRTARPAIHAGMDFDEMLSGYMKAHPVPAGVDEAQVVQVMRNLWNGA